MLSTTLPEHRQENHTFFSLNHRHCTAPLGACRRPGGTDTARGRPLSAHLAERQCSSSGTLV